MQDAAKKTSLFILINLRSLCVKEKEMFLMVYAFLLAFTSSALYADGRAIQCRSVVKPVDE